MVKRSHGLRHNTRKLLKKNCRQRGKISISKYFQSFKQGEKVKIIPEPSITKGMPFRRFYGRVGVVEGKRGNAYIIGIKDGKQRKQIICLPIHLKKV